MTQTVESAIEQSIAQDRIVRIEDATDADMRDLVCACDDSVAAFGETEFWGQDDEGNDWRVTRRGRTPMIVPLPDGVTVRRRELHAEEQQIRSLMGRISSALGRERSGRPRLDVPRCPCGAYTAATARKRGHKCEAPQAR